jgi:hypothetical protein
MTHDDWSGAIATRREFFEQEAAMFREAPTEVYGFRRHRERTGGNGWWIGGAGVQPRPPGHSLHSHCKPAEDKARYQADDEGYLRFEHATETTFYAMHQH